MIRIQGAARLAFLCASTVFILTYLLVALARITYPYELEWMEGGAVDHVRRILDGRPLYVEPTLGFIPYIYTPLYFYAAAAVSLATGAGFLPLRLVSLLSSLGCLGVIFQLVRRETGDARCGLAAAGLFAATYRLGGAWLDLARVDSLFLCLLLAGASILRSRATALSDGAAALVLTLAFLTKQTAAFVALALVPFCVLARRGVGRAVYPTALLGGLAVSTLLLDALSAGWFGYYVFSLPRQHAVEAPRILGFWLHDIARPLAIATGIALLHLWRARRRAGHAALFHSLLLGGCLAATWLVRVRTGSYDNVLLPAHAALAIGFGLGLGDGSACRASPPLRLSAAAIPLLALVQLLLLGYDPRAQIPTRADVEAGDRLVEAMRRIPGEVYLPMHGYLTALAGKPTFAHGQAVDDASRGADRTSVDALSAELTAAIRTRRFAAIILDATNWALLDEMQGRYDYRGPLYRDPSVLLPRTGLPARPQHLYLRRD